MKTRKEIKRRIDAIGKRTPEAIELRADLGKNDKEVSRRALEIFKSSGEESPEDTCGRLEAIKWLLFGDETAEGIAM